MKRRTSQKNRDVDEKAIYKPSEEYKERVRSQSYLGKKGAKVPSKTFV